MTKNHLIKKYKNILFSNLMFTTNSKILSNPFQLTGKIFESLLLEMKLHTTEESNFAKLLCLDMICARTIHYWNLI